MNRDRSASDECSPREYTAKDSRLVAAASLRMAMTQNRDEEAVLARSLVERGISAAAADFGGAFPGSIARMIETAIVAAKREGVIENTHAEEGAVAGACHEALTQIMNKASGLNVGGKIGVARYGAHLTVSVFLSIGLLYMNDVAVGMAHRYI